MSRIKTSLQPARELLRGLFRYLKGGEPVPEALDQMTEFLSGRDELSREEWIVETVRDSSVKDEVAGLAYDFFAGCHIPFGKARISDRLRDDLRFHEALQDDWDEYLADSFKDRFQLSLSFRRMPRIETLGDLLLFLQRRIDERNSPK